MPKNLSEQVTIGFGFTSDWLRKWCEFFKPIIKCSNSKTKVNEITFHTSENRSSQMSDVNNAVSYLNVLFH